MNHKYILLIILNFLIGIMPLIAQDQEKFDIDNFKKQKAEFIISEVGLTESESKEFIPLINELMDKKFELNRTLKKEARELRNKKNKTDLDYNRQIELEFQNRTQELQLDKEYYLKYKKVLSPEKIYKCRKAESKFMKTMVYDIKAKKRSQKK